MVVVTGGGVVVVVVVVVVVIEVVVVEVVVLEVGAAREMTRGGFTTVPGLVVGGVVPVTLVAGTVVVVMRASLAVAVCGARGWRSMTTTPTPTPRVSNAVVIHETNARSRSICPPIAPVTHKIFPVPGNC